MQVRGKQGQGKEVVNSRLKSWLVCLLRPGNAGKQTRIELEVAVFMTLNCFPLLN